VLHSRIGPLVFKTRQAVYLEAAGWRGFFCALLWGVRGSFWSARLNIAEKLFFFRAKQVGKPSISGWTFNRDRRSRIMLLSEDQRLLKKLHRGDREAVRRIYEKYRTDLFTVAGSLLHDGQACEDCVQDVFVRLAEGSSGWKIRRNLKGYLISCVANRARDHLRQRPMQLDCPSEISGCAIRLSDPAAEVVDREAAVRVFEALAELPYEQREVFVLHVQGAMRFREIAELQKVSIKTAQSRYRYAIERLRALLKKENEYEANA
jgi:RNA polymerase sigma factor (sigma-70 family)